MERMMKILVMMRASLHKDYVALRLYSPIGVKSSLEITNCKLRSVFKTFLSPPKQIHPRRAPPTPSAGARRKTCSLKRPRTSPSCVAFSP